MTRITISSENQIPINAAFIVALIGLFPRMEIIFWSIVTCGSYPYKSSSYYM
ncbi:MAG: hypothetical protein WA705_02225 [Candidatus Ozemobacteraceae bacterium]